MIASRGDKQIALRLPMDLRDRVKASAKENGRSANSEIVFAIERHLGALDSDGAEGLATTSPVAGYNNAALASGASITSNNGTVQDA